MTWNENFNASIDDEVQVTKLEQEKKNNFVDGLEDEKQKIFIRHGLVLVWKCELLGEDQLTYSPSSQLVMDSDMSRGRAHYSSVTEKLMPEVTHNRIVGIFFRSVISTI